MKQAENRLLPADFCGATIAKFSLCQEGCQVSRQYGSLLRQIRTDRKMRLLDLSRLSKLDVSYLSRIETGDRPVPDLDVCKAIHTALQLSSLDEEALVKAAAEGRQTKKASFPAMGRDEGLVCFLPARDILRLLKAQNFRQAIILEKEEPKM